MLKKFALIALVVSLSLLVLSCSNLPGTVSPVCSAAKGVCQAASAICDLIVRDTTSVETIQLAQKDLETSLQDLRLQAIQYYTIKHAAQKRDSIGRGSTPLKK